MPFARSSDGAEIYFEVRGNPDGPNVFLGPHFYASRNPMVEEQAIEDPTVGWIEGLGDRYRLILADYPNANGWQIGERDLLLNETLIERTSMANVVLCNPPFEAFAEKEKALYPEMIARSFTKSAAALSAVLETHPVALGFVLPRAFLDERQFQSARRRVEVLYSDIELVSLPERTFKASSIESALLIARSPRLKQGVKRTSLRSSVVAQRDRTEFLRAGTVTRSRTQVRP